MDYNALFNLTSGSTFDRLGELPADQLASAEVDGDGMLVTVSPVAQIKWGWTRGSLLPGDLLIVLEDLDEEEPRQLPLQMGGLHMGAVKKPGQDGWLIFGYVPEDPGSSDYGDDLEFRNHPAILRSKPAADRGSVRRYESENVIIEPVISARSVLDNELEEKVDSAENELRRVATISPDHAIYCDSAMRFIVDGVDADRAILTFLNGDGQLTPYTEYTRRPHSEIDFDAVRTGLFEFRETVGGGGSVHIDRNIASELCDSLDCVDAVVKPVHDNGRLSGFLFIVWTEDRSGSSIHERQLLHRSGRLADLFESLYSWIAANARYRETVSAIDDALFSFSINPDFTRSYIFITEQLSHLTGYRPTELVQTKRSGITWMEDLVHEGDKSLVRAHNMTLREGNESRIVYRIKHRDGTVRWLREHATPTTDSAGIQSVSGIITDVSEMKAAEEVLLQAKKEAEAADKSKTAFIATMSHEIRTPIGAMSGYSQLLEKELADFESRIGIRLPDQVQEFVDVLIDRSQRLQGLVQDLFELSNVEMGRVALQKVDMPLHEVIRKAADKVRQQLETKGVELRLLIHGVGPIVSSDPRRVEQILDNVLSNAVKFTELGSVTIRTNTDVQGATVEIEDTGIGISKEYQGELFQAFSQEENWRNRKFEGTGLGLALTRRLLDLMDGRIEVESEKGNGSLFRITLPLAETED